MRWNDEERDVRRHTAHLNSGVEGLSAKASSISYWAAQTDDPITPALVREFWPTKNLLIDDLLRERFCGPLIAIEIGRWANYDE